MHETIKAAAAARLKEIKAKGSQYDARLSVYAEANVSGQMPGCPQQHCQPVEAPTSCFFLKCLGAVRQLCCTFVSAVRQAW